MIWSWKLRLCFIRFFVWKWRLCMYYISMREIITSLKIGECVIGKIIGRGDMIYSTSRAQKRLANTFGQHFPFFFLELNTGTVLYKWIYIWKDLAVVQIQDTSCEIYRVFRLETCIHGPKKPSKLDYFVITIEVRI